MSLAGLAVDTLSQETILSHLNALEHDQECGHSIASCLRHRGIPETVYWRRPRKHGGERFDHLAGDIQPWLTHLALDEIQEWDLRDKTVLDWGGSSSTLWPERQR